MSVTGDKPVIAISLLREIAQAISHLSPDRAMRFLVDSAVAVTESRGAVLLTPHEKLREMVPMIESLPHDHDRPAWTGAFLGSCFRAFHGGIMERYTPDRPLPAELAPGPEAGSVLLMPVKLAGKPVALLFIFRRPADGDFTPEHQSFLEILTPFLGSLLENFRLHTEMIHKNSRLSALYDISQRAESMIDLRDVYDALGKVIQSFIDFDVYLLYLVSPDGTTLEARSTATNAPYPTRVAIGEGQIGKAAREQKPYLTYTEEYKSVLVLPVVVSGRLMGVVMVASRKSYAYRDEDIIGLRIITTQIASIDHLFRDLLRLRGFTQHILESMTSGVLIFDNNGVVTFANHEMARILERPVPEGWTAERGGEIMPPPLLAVVNEALEGKVTLENRKLRLEHVSPPCILEVNAFPFRDEQGMMLGTACFCKDVTQVSRLEDQLKRADRLSALGVLAAGIAHEIRNPLTGMKMIVQLLMSEFQDGDPKREPLTIIQNEIDRLERIIANLLDFARPTKPKAVPLDLPEILDACFLLIRNQFKKAGVALEKQFPEELPTVVGDSDQLKQVFLNILTNAIQAMKAGGKLTVRIESRPNGLVTAFQDTGCGIHADRLRTIFDPFMTTKEDGTGLGLSTALRIVEEHGGRIEVDSVLGQGSTFSVFLPLQSEAQGAAQHA
ncbi:MAG TPA: ATP-binding protein [Candidatus Ozemobacteraceae bacterium]